MYSGKKICSLLLAFLFLFTACGAFAEGTEPDYYRIGLEVTGLISEMVDSEAYLSMLTRPESISEVREILNTRDYDRPVAVYSVRLDDPKVFLEEMFRKSPDQRETWESLSPALQEQVLSRLGLQTLCTYVNAQMGSEYLSFVSVTNAFVREEALNPESAFTYLYVFEKGMPILVNFGYHIVSGQFLLIPEESRGTPEAISAYMVLPGLEITPVY